MDLSDKFRLVPIENFKPDAMAFTHTATVYVDVYWIVSPQDELVFFQPERARTSGKLTYEYPQGNKNYSMANRKLEGLPSNFTVKFEKLLIIPLNISEYY